MEEIGSVLRQAREQLGLTLEEVERATHIRARNLAILESGDWDSLASTVQARGFLKNYAEFLGLDAERLLTRYAEALQARRTRPRPEARPGAAPRRSVQVRSRRPRWLSSDLWVATLVTLTVLVILVWGLGRVTEAVRAGEATPTAEPATPTATSAPTEPPALDATAAVIVAPPAAIEPSPTNLPLILPGAGMSLRVLVVHSAWMRVTIDGDVAFSGRVRPGSLLEYVGQELIEINTGNGAGLRVYYNGEDQGTLGDLGEVVTRLWTPDGVITPTPTQTRTPTATPPITPTPPSPAGG